MVKVKICGLRRMEDVMAVNEIKPDFVGFVFAPSKRQISDGQALGFRHMLNREIQSVGVFVDDSIAHIAHLANHGIIDMIQLHGRENAFYIQQLRLQTDVPIIRAVRVRSREQILENSKLPVDYLLLDTYVDGQVGGSGQCFDTSMIPELDIPYFLAGGLSGENVAAAIKSCHPYGVDASSLLETDGWKDQEKMEAFVKAARYGGEK